MGATRRPWQMVSGALRHAWRLIVLVIGLSIVAVGVAMIVLPGPAFVVIPVGLAVLASEFVWARRLLHNLKERGRDLIKSQRPNNTGT